MKKTEDYVRLLTNSHNLVLSGPSGTGKTFLAKEIAKKLGCSEEEYITIQLHPSYEYTDFVEGPRLEISSSGQAVIQHVDGIFKKFCKEALKKSSSKKNKEIEKIIETKIREIRKFDMRYRGYSYVYTLSTTENDSFQFSILRDGTPPYYNKVTIRLSVLIEYFFSSELNIPNEDFDQNDFVKLYYVNLKEKLLEEDMIQQLFSKTEKSFVFIIDEINRGELSKIFGEVFSLIEHGHRGVDWRVQTQYQSLIPEEDVFSKGFYIPENVYIIGTMNDVDRSVESMDLAMRRRFNFMEITAADSAERILQKDNPVLSNLNDKIIENLKQRMLNLNNAIISDEIGFPPAYQIGAAYFLNYAMYKDEDSPFDCLWNYNFEPLLMEYLRGQGDIQEKMDILKAAYDMN